MLTTHQDSTIDVNEGAIPREARPWDRSSTNVAPAPSIRRMLDPARADSDTDFNFSLPPRRVYDGSVNADPGDRAASGPNALSARSATWLGKRTKPSSSCTCRCRARAVRDRGLRLSNGSRALMPSELRRIVREGGVDPSKGGPVGRVASRYRDREAGGYRARESRRVRLRRAAPQCSA
jgi:hypothetical protein